MTNETTTGEIVRALRCDGCDGTCSECFFGYEEKDSIGYETWGCRRNDLDGFAADRLESQERDIAGLRELNKAEYVLYKSEIDAYRIASESLKLTILRYMDMTQTLTARAEQAERERDAAVAVIGIQAEKLKESHVVLCNICEFEDMIGCVHKNHCDGYQLFKWRGLPQDGGGK